MVADCLAVAQVVIEPGEWRPDSPRVGDVEAVEYEDGMEVDDSSALELGDFGVGEPDSDVAGAGEAVKAAPQSDDRAAP